MLTKITSDNRWIGLLLLFYISGTIGIALKDYQQFFLPLTPLNLMLTLFIFLKVNNDFSKKFLLLSAIIFIIGFAIEAIGVATGVLFGNYNYGELFSFKIFETPILIGVNWLFLSLSAFGVVQYFTNKSYFLIVIPALIMTGLDFFIEPVAMKLGFWNWENNIIPLQNFVMWFITSIVIHSIIFYIKLKINAKVSAAIIVAQFIFFGALYLLIT